jgi:FkbM family methyltransferase
MRNIFRVLRAITPFKKQIFQIIKLIKVPPLGIYQHLHFNGTFTAKIYGKKSFKMNHFGNFIENVTFWEGVENGWEKISMRLWIELVKDAKCIMDIGAYTGLYTLVAGDLNKDARIFSFEPVTSIFDRMKYNVEINNYNVHCEKIALSNKESIVYVDRAKDEELCLDTSLNNQSHTLSGNLLEIKTKTLKTIIEENDIDIIDLIKIDVEMHEVELLEGMGEYLRIMKPNMIIEIVKEENALKVKKLIDGLGYFYFDINEKDPPKQVDVLCKSSKYNLLVCNQKTALKLNLIQS